MLEQRQENAPGTYTRRVSNYGATGPLAGRNSVNVRKTSVVLTKFDEGMPIGGSRKCFETLRQTQIDHFLQYSKL